MTVVLSAFPDSMKFKVDQGSSAKRLWKKLQNIYSKKHVGQDEDDSDHD